MRMSPSRPTAPPRPRWPGATWRWPTPSGPVQGRGARAPACVADCSCSGSRSSSWPPTCRWPPPTRRRPEPFDAADLKVEVNATDGDAGLQIFLDHEAWKRVSIRDPEGELLADFRTKGRLRDFGLTELFSESSEPPFGEFPLDEFKALFPEGDYTFRGVTTEGTVVQSTVPLTHDIPDGPEILAPTEDEVAPRDRTNIRWAGVTTPQGIDITGYEVIVSREDDERVLDVELG